MKNVHKLKSKVDSLSNRAVEKTSDLVAEGTEKAERLYGKAQKSLNKAEKNIKRYSHKVSKNIQKNPASIVLAVIGIACLIGSIWKRK
ncbi:hypothetical protein [Legionella impletisoli]|uniref:DUF883 domain-containing protein n=1 Tax=Legionella impletisoli TaxID=343510 RepID=A0A917JQQ4_9GAMM|nr:hypothetical protein [Legionella impletisoli]GGI81725.1 hypothetical protein GCM10007966_07790 [Legionella impletisoli]